MNQGLHKGRAKVDDWRLDLLHPFASLRQLVSAQARSFEEASDSETLLDLFLLVCAAEQVLADHMVAGTLDLSALTSRLSSGPVAATRVMAERVSAGLRQARLSTRDRNLVEMLGRIRELALQLGSALAGGSPPPTSEIDLAFAGSLPSDLAERRMKVPFCFRGVDLVPEDCFELARRFSENRVVGPVVVVGIRTSGSYMAPLCAGWLRAAGWPAHHVTVRETGPAVWLERGAWASSSSADVLLVDDPPVTGGAHASTAALLVQAGVDLARLTLLVPRIWEEQPEEVSAAFAGYQTVELRPSELHLRRQLVGEEIAEWVGGLSGKRRSARPLWSLDEVTEVARRHHLKQLFEVRGSGRVLVKGVGLGWFGFPARQAAERLQGWVPKPLGSRPGLLASCWEDGDPVRGAAGKEIGRYIAARLTALPLPATLVAPRGFRRDGWNQAAKLLSGAHGRLAPLQRARIRSLLIEAAAGGPACLIDGRMSREDWRQAGGRLLKTDFEEHAYDHEDLAWFDPAFDLAGALLELGPTRAAAEELITGYQAAGGDAEVQQRLPIAELIYGALLLRRWMLLAQEKRGQADWKEIVQSALSAEAALTWAVDAALADAFPVAPAASVSDHIWSLDVDGVLEDPAMGFSCTTPAGARALQLMRQAGAVVVLNTGRSLEEVQLRCDALGLDGGVAEYGGVVWDHRRGREERLLNIGQQQALDRVRKAAAELPGVHIDTRYRASVRCRRLLGESPRALAQEDTDHLSGVGGAEISTVQGYLQTDFHPASIDKGVGLKAVMRLLGARGTILAVGDTASDLPMLKLATRAYTPANASAEVRDAGIRLRRPRQAGLLEAAGAEHGARTFSRAIDGTDQVLRLLAARDATTWRRRSGGLSRVDWTGSLRLS